MNQWSLDYLEGGGRLPIGSPYAATLWWLSIEMGQPVDVLGLPTDVGEEFVYICQHMTPFRLKLLAAAAEPR